MSEHSFNFDKFVDDIEVRQEKRKTSRDVQGDIIEHDRLRRKRAELYHERWQNQIKWEK